MLRCRISGKNKGSEGYMRRIGIGIMCVGLLLLATAFYLGAGPSREGRLYLGAILGAATFISGAWMYIAGRNGWL